LIAKLKEHQRLQVPITELSELRTESDVEQKLVYPFLVHPSFLDIPHEWVRTCYRRCKSAFFWRQIGEGPPGRYAMRRRSSRACIPVKRGSAGNPPCGVELLTARNYAPCSISCERVTC
jgi:hypothetical protein